MQLRTGYPRDEHWVCLVRASGSPVADQLRALRGPDTHVPAGSGAAQGEADPRGQFACGPDTHSLGGQSVERTRYPPSLRSVVRDAGTRYPRSGTRYPRRWAGELTRRRWARDHAGGHTRRTRYPRPPIDWPLAARCNRGCGFVLGPDTHVQGPITHARGREIGSPRGPDTHSAGGARCGLCGPDTHAREGTGYPHLAARLGH